MHRLVSFVFKFLGASLIVMILFDTSLLVLDTISVHSKINSIAGVMQNEVAKNNCVPYMLEDLFVGQLAKVVDDSKVAVSVKTNISNDLVINNATYYSIGEENVQDYGELIYLAIRVEMSPSRIYFSNPSASGLEKEEGGALNYNMDYVYTVPCLRYLK